MTMFHPKDRKEWNFLIDFQDNKKNLPEIDIQEIGIDQEGTNLEMTEKIDLNIETIEIKIHITRKETVVTEIAIGIVKEEKEEIAIEIVIERMTGTENNTTEAMRSDLTR